MTADLNPYEAPVATELEISTAEPKRPLMGTVLIGLWALEGGFKACLVVAGLVNGFNPLQSMLQEYPSWNRLMFFLVVSFFVVETVGPWIGIYYLTGRRSRTLPFEWAIFRTLLVSVGAAMVATMQLMLYCELVNLQR
jgi:hypothetical protein